MSRAVAGVIARIGWSIIQGASQVLTDAAVGDVRQIAKDACNIPAGADNSPRPDVPAIDG